MKPKILILTVILCLFSWSCPKLPKAEMRITVSTNPILMGWNSLAELWYLRTTVTVTETAGVGVNVGYIKLEFVKQGSDTDAITSDILVDTRLVAMTGFRLDALKSMTYNIEEGMSSRYSNILKVTITGKDDNGYDISAFIEASLFYVD